MKTTKKIKPKSNEKSLIRLHIKEQIIYLLIFIFVLMISCFAALVGDISKTGIYYFAIATFAASGFICGFISGFKSRHNGIITGVKSVAVAIIFVLLTSFIFNSFDISIIKTLISTVLILLSGVIGAITGVNIRIKPAKRRK